MHKILFVYNADAGLKNAVIDTLHRALKPDSYPCNLCKLTHNFATQKPKWNFFIKSLQTKSVFLHRDQFYAQYPKYPVQLPAVFIEDDDGKLNQIMDHKDFSAVRDLNELIEILRKRLNGHA